VDDAMNNFDDLLAEAKLSGASDIHVALDRPPYIRIDGQLQAAGQEPFTKTDISNIQKKLIGQNQRAQQHLAEQQQADFSYAIADGTRFRVNVFIRRGQFAAALRLIPSEIKSVEELNLPGGILHFAELRQGFLLLTGPAGEGKSTALAAMINYINQTRSEHIITIEDPIEYTFTEAKSLIDQRELGRDASSFPAAIRATLRQDPDVILIGELRDRESMQTALTLAETGHLVMASLHTNDAAQTVERIIDIFPPSQQSQIRSQLAAALSGVVTMRLLPSLKGGRIPAVGIMVATTAIRNAIREDKSHQIEGIIQTSQEFGMQTLTKNIQDLVATKLVDEEVAQPYLTENTISPMKDRK